MRFLIALVVAVALLAVCERPLRRYPGLFYALSAALVALYFFGSASNATGGLWPYFLPLVQRCALAFVLFSIVMFAGALEDSSRLRLRIMAVRRQLSVMACIFAVGHIAFYAASYVPTIAATPTVNLALSLALATALVALMAILLATSLLAVKQRLKPSAWKGVQRLAYPFYLLMYVHLALLLLPSALSGKETALVSLSVYTAVFACYAILRSRRALQRHALARTVASQSRTEAS